MSVHEKSKDDKWGKIIYTEGEEPNEGDTIISLIKAQEKGPFSSEREKKIWDAIYEKGIRAMLS